MNINIFMTAHCLFRKAVTPLAHFHIVIALLTAEHVSILVWLNSRLRHILTLKQKAPYGLTRIKVALTHRHGLAPAVGKGHTYLIPAALGVLWA